MPYPNYTKKEVLEIIDLSLGRIVTLKDFWEDFSYFFWQIDVREILQKFYNTNNKLAVLLAGWMAECGLKMLPSIAKKNEK